MHDPFVFAVAGEHLGEEPEHRRVREDVVFEDHTLRLLAEEPADGTGHGGPAAQVLLAVQRAERVRPRQRVEQVPHFVAPALIVGHPDPWSVDGRVDHPRRNGLQRVDELQGGARPVERQHEHRGTRKGH